MGAEYPSQTWVVVGDVLVSFSPPGQVSTQNWQGFIKALRTEPITKYLSTSLGKPEVTSVQRKESAEILKQRGIRTAVVTDETFVRGIVTAIGWMGASNVSAFAWSDTKGAVKFLGVTGDQAERTLDALYKLRAKIEASVVTR